MCPEIRLHHSALHCPAIFSSRVVSSIDIGFEGSICLKMFTALVGRPMLHPGTCTVLSPYQRGGRAIGLLELVLIVCADDEDFAAGFTVGLAPVLGSAFPRICGMSPSAGGMSSGSESPIG